MVLLVLPGQMVSQVSRHTNSPSRRDMLAIWLPGLPLWRDRLARPGMMEQLVLLARPGLTGLTEQRLRMPSASSTMPTALSRASCSRVTLRTGQTASWPGHLQGTLLALASCATASTLRRVLLVLHGAVPTSRTRTISVRASPNSPPRCR